MRIRTRVTKFTRTKIGENYYVRYPGQQPSPQYVDWSPVASTSETVSDETAPGPPYRWVNPFIMSSTLNPGYNNSQDIGEHWVSGSGLLEMRYRGRYWTSLGITSPSLYGDAGSYNSQDLDALGATGWKKFKPVKPIADTGVMLGESREIPRQLRDAVKSLKALAFHPLKSVRSMSFLSNQHLAYQFGWLPLMRDLEKCYNALKNTDSWLKRVRKYNGEWEHRGGTVAAGSGSLTSGKAYLFPSPSGFSLPPEGNSAGDIYISWGYRVWFSAWFKYYIADFDSATTQLRLKARIWGLTNTPTIVWNLLPWSWLVDWFSNLGDNIDNLIPIDGLVAKMPCIMRHCWTRYDVRVTQRYKEPSGSFVTHFAENYKQVETKMRGKASPFGFGLSDADLSLRQLSILAALGIQRSGI